jgi:hypothetical protein
LLSGGGSLDGGGSDEVGGSDESGGSDEVGGSDELVGGSEELVGGWLELVGGWLELVGGWLELVGGWLELVGGWLELVGGWLELGGNVVAASAAVVLGTKLEAMPIMPPALTVSIAASASLEMFSILIGSLCAPRVGAVFYWGSAEPSLIPKIGDCSVLRRVLGQRDCSRRPGTGQAGRRTGAIESAATRRACAMCAGSTLLMVRIPFVLRRCAASLAEEAVRFRWRLFRRTGLNQS